MGKAFDGRRIPLGALVYYKPPNHKDPPVSVKDIPRDLLWLAFGFGIQVQGCAPGFGLRSVEDRCKMLRKTHTSSCDRDGGP